jgi:hypothetical protein
MYKCFYKILIGLCLVGLQVCVAQTVDAQSLTKQWRLPDSPAGHATAAFLEAVHRKDINHTRAFIEEKFAPSFKSAYSMEEHLEQFQWMHENIGELKLISAQKTSETSCRLTIQSKETSEQFTAELLVEPDAPYLIASVSVKVFKVFEITESAKDTTDDLNATNDSQLTDIAQFDQLARDFHRDKGDVRLITLLSPT